MSSFRTLKQRPRVAQALKVLGRAKAAYAIERDRDVAQLQAIAGNRAGVCMGTQVGGMDQNGPIHACHACDPAKDGKCLWAKGLLQDQHRPDLWGIRAQAANFKPTNSETVSAVILLAEVPRRCRGIRLDGPGSAGEVDASGQPVVHPGGRYSGCAFGDGTAHAEMPMDCPTCVGEGFEDVEPIETRDDARTVASILAQRVPGVALVGPEGIRTWIGHDNGLAALGALPVAAGSTEVAQAANDGADNG